MIKTSTEDITCTDSFKCANILLKKHEKLLNKKLIKDKETDPRPDGSVSILHIQHSHIITVEIYDKE